MVLIVTVIVQAIRMKKQQFTKRILYLILTRYAIPHFSFCFLAFALVHQLKKDESPLTKLFYNAMNVVAPLGTFILII